MNPCLKWKIEHRIVKSLEKLQIFWNLAVGKNENKNMDYQNQFYFSKFSKKIFLEIIVLRDIFNDTKFIKIEALVEKWQAKQKLVHT